MWPIRRRAIWLSLVRKHEDISTLESRDNSCMQHKRVWLSSCFIEMWRQSLLLCRCARMSNSDFILSDRNCTRRTCMRTFADNHFIQRLKHQWNFLTLKSWWNTGCIRCIQHYLRIFSIPSDKRRNWITSDSDGQKHLPLFPSRLKLDLKRLKWCCDLIVSEIF